MESRTSVDTHRLSEEESRQMSGCWTGCACTHRPRLSQAVLEYARVIVTGHIPAATHDVVNVIAQARGLRAFFASSDAELGGRHEVLTGQVNHGPGWETSGTNGPFMQLLQLAIVEHAREDETADGIACKRY